MFRQKNINLSEHDPISGTYNCKQCGHHLFEAAKKFDAGCGFPSFWKHIDEQMNFNPLEAV